MDAIGLLTAIQSNSGSPFQIISTRKFSVSDKITLTPPSEASAAIFLSGGDSTNPSVLYTICASGGSARLQQGIDSGIYADFDWSGASVTVETANRVLGTVIWLK